ncbi:related to IMP-specific 5'-nucleotidase 1 [Saccharomycodes ludwigii]|uniref:IMP-specific 5'-nucleotidase 1 n=1 Tax=Saccharomycodes ludwigii TaxID=36035 RepID=A0A376B725_9ASCO|nr:hypothetical protein SCDLUD_003278 [Saccharomycodes ludwigii]KAH3900306.1 hypothetical protein SCDLUD_003278 [Saccharomycodes ludwigii]SSD60468.1 related to IMP-specific 5'-nucleotidase 1 [Saccharomycodes ludwigii]
MSSRYRIEYQLKQHRKDEFIEWIKGLLAVPFVLHSVDPVNNNNSQYEDEKLDSNTNAAHKKYLSIFKDIEDLVWEKLQLSNSRNLTIRDPFQTEQQQQEDSLTLDFQKSGVFDVQSRLDQLVPSIGPMFTGLPLTKAFILEDSKKKISCRRFVSPSFNDIRHILNTAQILQFGTAQNDVRLITFDGDVTLYEDGGNLTTTNRVVPRIISLLKLGVKIGIVTAAGYDEPEKYEERLYGLIQLLQNDIGMDSVLKKNLLIMGGESNYLFQYSETNNAGSVEGHFVKITPQSDWLLESMQKWSARDMNATLDLAEILFETLKEKLNLPKESKIIRKERAVGIVPGYIQSKENAGEMIRLTFQREQLEEMVLTVQKHLERFPPANRVKFSCFDGGNDCWCDIGGKDLGLKILQKYFHEKVDNKNKSGAIQPSETLHIGDQFAPMGSANDFKARLSGCTLWIASPKETVDVLDLLLTQIEGGKESKKK